MCRLHFCYINLIILNFLKKCDKLPGESLKVCKVILGVHKKATNNAVRGELGSFPILKEYSVILIKSFYDINQQILRKNGYFQNFS